MPRDSEDVDGRDVSDDQAIDDDGLDDQAIDDDGLDDQAIDDDGLDDDEWPPGATPPSAAAGAPGGGLAPSATLAPFEVVVTDGVGERLDRWLAALARGPSRAVFQRWIDDGRVTVDGQPTRAKDRVRAGARVRVEPSPPLPSRAEPEAIPLDVRYEDEHVAILVKPAGLVVHPGAGHPTGTLVNALLHRYGSVDGPPLRPGIVHRLDKDTSGVMITARTELARERLVATFQAHAIDRVYRALVVGSPPDAITYRTLHARHPTDRKRFTSRTTRGREAITHLVVLERLPGAALVECRLETGRTHQIRVHAADHGHPLLGDPTYGAPPRDPAIRAIGAALGRQALHAAVLGLAHPVTGAPLRVEAAWPDDLARALAALRALPRRR